jgi:hypothetical protein
MSRIECRLRSFLETGGILDDLFANYYKDSSNYYERLIQDLEYVLLSETK